MTYFRRLPPLTRSYPHLALPFPFGIVHTHAALSPRLGYMLIFSRQTVLQGGEYFDTTMHTQELQLHPVRC